MDLRNVWHVRLLPNGDVIFDPCRFGSSKEQAQNLAGWLLYLCDPQGVETHKLIQEFYARRRKEAP